MHAYYFHFNNLVGIWKEKNNSLLKKFLPIILTLNITYKYNFEFVEDETECIHLFRGIVA